MEWEKKNLLESEITNSYFLLVRVGRFQKIVEFFIINNF